MPLRERRSPVQKVTLLNVTNRSGPICIYGKQVPQLYLLGAQFAGTSIMASDLFDTGIASAFGNRQEELHTFDVLCDFPEGGVANRSLLAGRCDGSDPYRDAWLKLFSPCHEDGDALGDMTSSNVRLPGLPTTIHRWYSSARWWPAFIVGLAEPVGRMYSGFRRDKETYNITKFTCFADYVDYALKEGELMLAETENETSDALSRRLDLDQLYRSMYASNLEPWLSTFAPDRFAVVVMGQYVKQLERRQTVLKQIYEHFQLTAGDPHKLVKDVEAHDVLAPDVGLAEEVIDALNTKFFFPDSRKLSEMLADGIKRGLLLPGYNDTGSDITILAFIYSNWVL